MWKFSVQAVCWCTCAPDSKTIYKFGKKKPLTRKIIIRKPISISNLRQNFQPLKRSSTTVEKWILLGIVSIYLSLIRPANLSHIRPETRYFFPNSSNKFVLHLKKICLLYTSPSPRDATLSRMPSSA